MTTIPNGPSAEMVRECYDETVRGRVIVDFDAFAAALWSRWQRSQPDLDAVKRAEAERIAKAVTERVAQMSQVPLRSPSPEQLAVMLFANRVIDAVCLIADGEYPAAPPKREPRCRLCGDSQKVEVRVNGVECGVMLCPVCPSLAADAERGNG